MAYKINFRPILTMMGFAAFATLVVLAGTGMACSDSSSSTPDLGPDSLHVKKDGQPPQKDHRGEGWAGDLADPDAPKKPARWEDVPGTGPTGWDLTATLLQDGRVLITGGRRKTTGVVPVADTWLYNPPNQAWTQVQPLAEPRYDHTATRLADGRVLIAGGVGSGSTLLSSTALFDPKTATWSAGPSLPGKRAYHAAVLLSSGNVLLVGGYGDGNQLDSMALFLAQAGAFSTPLTKMTVPRANPTATLLKTGRVLIVGGYHYTNPTPVPSDYTDVLEIYDPITGTMTASASKLGLGRATHTANLLSDGRVLIVGGWCGSSCSITGDELYDPIKDKVQSIAHDGTARYEHAAALLLDGRILVTGGEGNASTKVSLFTTLAGGAWLTAPSLKHGRSAHATVALADGTALAVGGKPVAGDPPVTPAERFYP